MLCPTDALGRFFQPFGDRGVIPLVRRQEGNLGGGFFRIYGFSSFRGMAQCGGKNDIIVVENRGGPTCVHESLQVQCIDVIAVT